MTEPVKDVSDETRRDADLSDPELWLRYFSLGGMSTPAEVESYLHMDIAPSVHDHDVLAQALNERFSELGRNHPVGYSGSEPSNAVTGVKLALLGSFGLRVNGEAMRLPMNAQRLVAFLALHGGSLLRQHVAGSLWADSTEERASGSLRSALWRLGHPAQPIVEVTDAHLRLSPFVDVDVHAGEALAHRVLDDSRDLSEADLDVGLLGGDLLPDWTEDWVLVARESHTQLRLRALEALCGRLTALGRHGEAVQAGMLAVSIEPLRESAQRALVAAHLAEGNTAAAGTQYDSFRELMRTELDMEPSSDMQILIQGMKR